MPLPSRSRCLRAISGWPLTSYTLKGTLPPLARRAETPEATTQQRVPGRGPSVSPPLRDHRHPVPDPRARSPRSREAWPLAPAWRFETPTLRLKTLKPGPSCSVAGPLERFNRERRVVVKSAPRAEGAISPKRAGTERPDQRVETLDPTERLFRGTGTARVRAGLCLLGRTRRRVGGLRSMRSPSDRS